jgi:hypothetical protein
MAEVKLHQNAKCFHGTPSEPGTTKPGSIKSQRMEWHSAFLEWEQAKNDKAWNEHSKATNPGRGKNHQFSILFLRRNSFKYMKKFTTIQ